jgi:aryl-alcohol dehydrogenase-like predicted oxidoreductase
MQYRTLGRTGLQVSALSFGASSLGGVFREVEASQCVRTVHLALSGGINFIDTSPFYGLGKAETMLGKALDGVPRDRYILSTKAGRYGSTERDFDFSAARVKRSLDESLRRIGVDYVDILLAHDIEFADVQQIIHETIPALRELQKSRKARYIGVSGLPIKVLRDVVQAADVDVILSYCHFTLNDDALLELLALLKQREIGIINAAPLATGLLSERPAPAWHPAPAELKETCRRAAAHCRAAGSRIEKLAIEYSIGNPDIATTLVSSADPDEMRDNILWANQPLDRQLLAEVKAILKPLHNMTWQSGRIENN